MQPGLVSDLVLPLVLALLGLVLPQRRSLVLRVFEEWLPVVFALH